MNNDRWSVLGNRSLNGNAENLNLDVLGAAMNTSSNMVDSSIDASNWESSNVSVRIGEILPYLAKAYEQGRQWARDFDDDKVQIPRDLLETIRLAKIFDQQKS